MPRPAESGRKYVAGLDGLRAIAVLAVIAYHLNFSWAKGGKLGVGIFFTLSGYLITDLLLDHWRRNGSLGLGNFWVRRARRLLPALFVMLAVVSVFAAIFDASYLAEIRKQVFAASLYISNWWTIADHGSYFAQFAPPLPLDHLWSLAIEEQFYLVWPWLLWLGLKFVRSPVWLSTLALGGAIVSAIAMALLYHPGLDPTRVYEGTDTRAFELLFGIALAFVWPSSGLRAGITEGARNLLDGAGAFGLAVILALIATTGSYAPFLYHGGFVILAIATAVLVGVIVHPASRLGVLLGWGALRWVGVRSYGIYLWQWPIIVFTNPAGGGVNLLRGAGQVAATLLIASLSWKWIEEPIRRRGLRQFVLQLRARAAELVLVPRRAFAVAGIAALAVALPVLGLLGALPEISGQLASARTGTAELPARLTAGRTTGPVAGPPATQTSCKRVFYIGDSTSEGVISTNYIPKEQHRLPAQLRQIGVGDVETHITDALAIVERFEAEPSAAEVARQAASEHPHQCWILALGTNDAATITRGSNAGPEERIAEMMRAIGPQPVLWVDVVSRLSSGYYKESGMERWNRALLAACDAFPNMRVFDWAGVARRSWFIDDGIHYTTPGYVNRTHLIAQALLEAFPGDRPPAPDCVVG
jgi:peptidoglycan/LPS O-acetylase OafA/YrhL/lysophospholipase L1-like esterase